MGKITAKYKIEILSKILEVPGYNVPAETNKIIKIDKKTVQKLIRDNQSLVFEIKKERFSGYRRQNNNKDSYYDLPKFKIGDYELDHKLIKSDKIERPYDSYDGIYRINGKNGVFRITIRPDLLESFLKIGTVTLTHSNGAASKIDVKILNQEHIQVNPLASFLIAGKYANHPEHYSFTNHKEENLNNNIGLRNQYNIFSDHNILNMMPEYITSRYSSSRGEAKVKRKPYILVKLALTHPNQVNMNIIAKNKDKKLDEYNVPQSYYEGIVGFRAEVDETVPAYKAKEFIQLAPLNEIDWVDINGEKFIPINYSREYIEGIKETIITRRRYIEIMTEDSNDKRKQIDEIKKDDAIFEEKIFEDQFILRPYNEGLSLVYLIHNPHTNKWVRGITPLKDQSKTIIYLDEKSQIWKSTETDIWGSVDKKAIDVFAGINNNFSVECLYTERYTYATSQGLGKYKSAPLEDRCVPLVNYIPETKRERKIWYGADKILIQQSTFGLEAENMAKIVQIDPKTKKIIKVFDMNNLAGIPFKVDGKDFRDGKIAIVLGPNRARIDVSPVLWSKPTHSETHGIFAGGYRTNNKSHNLSFNY